MMGIRSYETRSEPVESSGIRLTLVERTTTVRLGGWGSGVFFSYRRPLAIEMDEGPVRIRDHHMIGRLALVLLLTIVYLKRRVSDDRPTA